METLLAGEQEEGSMHSRPCSGNECGLLQECVYTNFSSECLSLGTNRLNTTGYLIRLSDKWFIPCLEGNHLGEGIDLLRQGVICLAKIVIV